MSIFRADSLCSRITACVVSLVSAVFPVVQSVTATSAIGLSLAPVFSIASLALSEPAFAQVDFAPATAKGSSTARAAAGAITPPTINPTTGQVTINSTNPVANGKVMTGEQLIPGSTEPGKKAASDSNVGVFGDRSAMGSGASTGSNNLLSAPPGDAYGDAYKTVRSRAVQSSRPDQSRDPIVQTSKSIYNGTDTNGFLASMTSACQTTTTPTNAPVLKHVADYRTCERTPDTSGCRVTRPFKEFTFQGTNSVFTYKGPVKHYLRFEIKLRTPTKLTYNSVQPDGVNAEYHPDQEAGAAAAGIYFKVLDEFLIPGFTSEITIETIPEEQWPVPAPEALVVYQFNLDSSASTGGFGNIYVDQEPSEANGWVARFAAEHFAPGDGYLDLKGSFLIGTATPLPIVDEPLGCSTPRTNCSFDPVPWVSTGSVNDLASTNAWKCVNASMDRKIGIVPITPDKWPNLDPLYPGEPMTSTSPICFDAEARNFQCHYPSVPGPVDTCTALETTPGCAFLRSECLPENIDPVTGRCILHTLHFDCGTDVAAPNTTTTTTSCAGPIRCMGTECVEPQPKEQNADFNKAAAQLGMVQWMDSDKECTPGGECRVFKGKGYRCRDVFWGVQNCCDQPSNTTMADYIKLAFYTYKLTNWTYAASMMESAGLGSVTSGFQALSGAASETYSAISEPIISAWQSLASNFSSSLGEAVTDFSVDKIKETAAAYLQDWGESIFGEAFGEFVGEAGVSGLINEAGALMETLSTFMMYYAIVMILVQIVWSCEDTEFELATKKALNSCHSLGSYCSSRILGVCYERSKSYCCFNSPLARIIQEQVRPQLGLPWPGADSNPNCEGLTTAQLALVDWDRVDLTEWLSYLKMAGLHPTDSASADAMYSAGNATTYGNAPGHQGMTTTEVTTQAVGKPNTPMTTVNNVSTKMWGGLP